MQSEMPADCTGNTCCLTPLSEQKAKQTSSHTLSPSSQRKTPPRSKKGKVCTACPCGTVLGAAEDTSSLHSQDRPNPCTAESHKGTRKNCLNQTSEESLPPQKHQLKIQDPVKKAGKKRSSKNPHEDKALLEGSTSETSHDISPISSVNITLSAASDNPSMSFSKKQQDPKIDEFPTQSLYTLETLDAEEIKRRERIKRLKDLLKEKEAALERMQSMNI